MVKSGADAAVIFCFEDEPLPPGTAASGDGAAGHLVRKMIEAGDLRGKYKEVHVLYPPDASGLKRIIMAGLGKRSETDAEKVSGASALAARRARSLKLHHIAAAAEGYPPQVTREAFTRALVEGAKLGLYQFTPFKTENREEIHEIESLTVYHEDKAGGAVTLKAVREGEAVADAVIFARNLVSMPSNEMTPNDMAREAMAIAAARKSVTAEILDEAMMREIGMNALLGVTRGSREEARFIIMEYRGGKAKERPIVLVGKGLTFDSGGISLKHADGMEEMKTDMAGGAAVMGAIMAAADLRLPLRIIGLIPATENMPGGLAYKPGDVLKTLSGLTVEVISTDAEGRLILADALAYAQRYEPKAVIDVATLTGACVIALGDCAIGMMGKEENLKQRLRDAGEETGERVWELPLWPEHYEAIKSDIADLKNIGGRPGGAITAGAFLSKFSGSAPWAHLDIAGPAWVKKDRPYIPKGASGVGVRLLVSLLMNWNGD